MDFFLVMWRFVKRFAIAVIEGTSARARLKSFASKCCSSRGKARGKFVQALLGKLPSTKVFSLDVRCRYLMAVRLPCVGTN